jgi:hypothetical protein
MSPPPVAKRAAVNSPDQQSAVPTSVGSAAAGVPQAEPMGTQKPAPATGWRAGEKRVTPIMTLVYRG